MTDVVLKDGWDGEWFLRAYDFSARRSAPRRPRRPRSSSSPRASARWRGLASRRPGGEGARFGEGAARHQVRHRAEQPALTSSTTWSWARLSYPPGYKENAGIFCHNNPWVIIRRDRHRPAATARSSTGRRSRPPTSRSRARSRRSPTSTPRCIAGKDAVRHGEAKNWWLTGTAAWTFVAIAHYLLGVRADFDGLRVHPCMGGEVARFTVDAQVPRRRVPHPRSRTAARTVVGSQAHR